ncbi:MAG: hypothetical protein CMD92_07120 [Gammaproteobacteria bacterium]|nr:hypothetical protein [Gammaproteobacteria bacterium]
MKGVSGDVIILEEAAYCDPGLVAEVYALPSAPRPLAGSSRTARVCLFQRRAVAFNAAVGAAVHQHNFGFR